MYKCETESNNFVLTVVSHFLALHFVCEHHSKDVGTCCVFVNFGAGSQDDPCVVDSVILWKLWTEMSRI